MLFRDDASGELRSVVVQHAAHSGWGFPKGKCEEGELVEETAIREVAEETGYLCTIVADVGYTRYSFTSKKGVIIDKQVDWFLMQIDGAQEPTHAEEIMAIAMPEVAQLSGHLTYEDDRQLLARALPQIEQVADRIGPLR